MNLEVPGTGELQAKDAELELAAARARIDELEASVAAGKG